MTSKEALDILYFSYLRSSFTIEARKKLEQDLDRLEKYKNAIEILKDNFPIKFLGYNKYGAKPYEIMFNGYIMGFEKEPYQLLKEVLGDD